MSNNITPEVVTALQSSITGLVDRIMAKAGMSLEQVSVAITDYVDSIKANDTQAQNGTGDTLVTVSQASLVAQKAIGDWVGAAPEALDTLIEISERLNTDAGSIENLIATIGTKADKIWVEELVSNSGVKTGVLFNAGPTYRGLFGDETRDLQTVAPGKYIGTVNSATLKLNGADVIIDAVDAIPNNTSLQLEATVSVGGVTKSYVADSSVDGDGQTSFPYVGTGAGDVTVILIDGNVTYDARGENDFATVGTVDDSGELPLVILNNKVPAGTSVQFITYSAAAGGEDVFHVATLKAFYLGREFIATTSGEFGIVPLDWSSASYMVDELAAILTAAFDGAVPAGV